MNDLDLLLLVSIGTTAVLFAFGTWRWAGALGTLLYALQLALLAVMRPELPLASGIGFEVLGYRLQWSLSGLGWFFAIITVASALFSAWFAAGEWGQHRRNLRLLHGGLALNVTAMLILLASDDLISLFIGWELVSWASYLAMVQRGGPAMDAAYRYLVYALAGALAVLVAIAMIAAQSPALDFGSVRVWFASAGNGTIWTVMLLTMAGFGVKMGLLPLHLWQPAAYSESPGPIAAFLGAISSRMGLFAIIVVLAQLIGLERLGNLPVAFSFWNANEFWAWLAALTLIVPTFIALTQNDARMLLAWHGIGQGGYMLLGILIATPLGVSGGLMHVINYACYQAALFLAVTAVAHRTGTTDLDHLGGLINRMPLTYVTMLFCIIGLAGLPPMNGFVSKWMIYKALLDAQMPLLFVAAVIGTLGTILSVYKLIHNTFLGQLRLEHAQVNEVPISMWLPMILLALIVFITGWMPGLFLDLVDEAVVAIGITQLPHHLGGVDLGNGGLDMLWIVGVLLAAIGIGAIVYFLGNRSVRVGQFDNYAGGQILTADVPYQYSHQFYAGLLRVIQPWMRGGMAWGERALVSGADFLGGAMSGLYRAAPAGAYLLLAVLAALAVTLL
ncbi:MAG: NADH dehydrogenase subunit [Chromatiales bacterium]|nr:NADH dehydrogenase subunit [Chromatiales bacterium]